MLEQKSTVNKIETLFGTILIEKKSILFVNLFTLNVSIVNRKIRCLYQHTFVWFFLDRLALSHVHYLYHTGVYFCCKAVITVEPILNSNILHKNYADFVCIQWVFSIKIENKEHFELGPRHGWLFTIIQCHHIKSISDVFCSIHLSATAWLNHLHYILS